MLPLGLDRGPGGVSSQYAPHMELAASPRPVQPARTGSRRVQLLSVLTGVGTALFSLGLYGRFSSGYDLAIFTQAIRHYSRFQAPLVPVKGPDFTILGDHFHLILVVLAPLFWVWDDPRVLLLAQSALIAVSVPIVHRFARRRLDPNPAFVLCVGYAIGWPLQAMAGFDFHEIAFGVPLIAWAVDSVDRRDDRRLLMAAGLLLFVREDLGMVVLMLGLLRCVRPPRRVGYALVVIGLSAYVLTTAVILPHYSVTGRYGYWSYDSLGSSVPTALRAAVEHPWRLIRLFFSPFEKTRTLLLLFAPMALLSLRSRYCLLALPLLAERFLSSRETLWGTDYHYSAIVWPVVVLSAIDGAARLNLLRSRTFTWTWTALPASFAVLGMLMAPSVFPMRGLFDGQVLRSTGHQRAQQAAVREVPAGVCVIADDRMAVHFAIKDRVSLPGRLGRSADFTVVDLSRTVTGSGTPAPAEVMNQAQAHGDSVVYSAQQVVVLRSATFVGPTPACRP